MTETTTVALPEVGMGRLDYAAVIRKLDAEEGGGYLVEVPDLPGCMSDGETIAQALANADAAIDEWIAAAREEGREIPEPDSLERYSGRWVQRVPRGLHRRLAQEAERQGVSINALATTLLAEGLGRRDGRR